MARNFHLHISDSLRVTASFAATSTHQDVQSIRETTDLLIQGIIVQGAKTQEGRLVEAVGLPWFDIVEILKNDPAAVYQIPPLQWE